MAIRKIAISGKGGVGKSTLAASIAYVYSERGQKVFAIDADPDGNLGAALGMSADLLNKLTPISELQEIVQERTGAKPGSSGTFFRLNPRVDDLPERFSVEQQGVRLLVMGTVKSGGGGCVCPESALLRALLTHMTLQRNELVILDMEAGIEHLGRATASAVDAFIIVVEPGQRSIQTAYSVSRMAKDIGIRHIYAVGNKIRDDSDKQFIQDRLDAIPLLGFIPFSNEIIEADLLSISAYHHSPILAEAVRSIVSVLEA